MEPQSGTSLLASRLYFSTRPFHREESPSRKSGFPAKRTQKTYPAFHTRQATINVGTIGHVAHGKSTVVKSLTGTSTIKYKSEKERNITIKLGYANAKIYRAKDVKDPSKQYQSCHASTPDVFEAELANASTEEEVGKKFTWEVQRHISFVDCPGHDILMATMLNGAAVMDAALLMVAANDPCPMPQTSEHLAAVEIMQLKNIIILQNKVELVKPEMAEAQKKDIDNFVEGTTAEKAPLIPISAVLKYNMDVEKNILKVVRAFFSIFYQILKYLFESWSV